MNVKVFGVCFEAELLQKLDKMRGDTKRSTYLARLVKNALNATATER